MKISPLNKVLCTLLWLSLSHSSLGNDIHETQDLMSLTASSNDFVRGFSRRGAHTNPLVPVYNLEAMLLRSVDLEQDELSHLVKKITRLPLGMNNGIRVNLDTPAYQLLLEHYPGITTKQGAQVGRVIAKKSHALRRLKGKKSLWITDNTLNFVQEYLKQGEPLMFGVQGIEQGQIWETVRDDFHKTTQEVASLFDAGTHIGGGEYGYVSRISRANGVQYALKKMSSHRIENLNEIAILMDGSCKDCLQYYGAVKKGSSFYLASEYAAEGDLNARRDRPGSTPLSHPEISQLLQQGKQLAENALIHTDIKPRNIVVFPGGKLKIMDFGLAQRSPKRFTFGGSIETVAPEVFRHKKVNAHHDSKAISYSLAMTVLGDRLHKDHMSNIQVCDNNKKGRSNLFFFKAPLFKPAEAHILQQMSHPDPYKRITPGVAAQLWDNIPLAAR
ncbi:MAG: protein kinase [Zetaproteobacteria bacterium]|nr:protein kinase [Zetaproteobacteria bacterium]